MCIRDRLRLIRPDRISDLSDSLAWGPLPPAEEIRARPEFTVGRLTAEYDAAWAKVTDAG